MSEFPGSQMPPGGVPLELSYAAPARGITAFRQATWIVLLVKGSLTVLGGLCMGGSLAFVFYLMLSPGGMGPARPLPPEAWLVLLVMTGVPLAFGAAEFACSFGVRRISLAATIVALVLEILQFLGAAFVVVMGCIRAFQRGPVPGNMWVGLAFYAALALVVGVVAIMLVKVLAEGRRTA